MAVDQVNKAMQMQMMTQMFKSALGADSNAFQLVMESLTQAMDNGNGDLSSLGLEGADYSKLGYGQGQLLQTPTKKQQPVHLSNGNSTIEDAVTNAARKYNVDKDLVNAVIQQESSFDPNSTSGAGAMGLMQLMPGTAKEMGVNNAYDIQQNVDGGTKYLKMMLEMNKNNKELALASYNAGPQAVKGRGVTGPADYYKLPNETQDYINKVMKYYGK